MATNLLQEYYELREKRLKLQHEADRIEQLEKDIVYKLTKDLDPSQLSYVHSEGGFIFKAVRKLAPNVTNWDETLAYIRAEAALDLLQRRLTESAVKIRWEDGIDIPGIEKVIKWPVNITKE